VCGWIIRIELLSLVPFFIRFFGVTEQSCVGGMAFQTQLVFVRNRTFPGEGRDRACRAVRYANAGDILQCARDAPPACRTGGECSIHAVRVVAIGTFIVPIQDAAKFIVVRGAVRGRRRRRVRVERAGCRIIRRHIRIAVVTRDILVRARSIVATKTEIALSGRVRQEIAVFADVITMTARAPIGGGGVAAVWIGKR